jgi:tRNA 2-thiouridine synthesizing protein A
VIALKCLERVAGGNPAPTLPEPALVAALARVYVPDMPFDEILVDARGHHCPVPTLRLRRALSTAPAGVCVRLLADDPLARIDVPHFAAEVGASVLELSEDAGTLNFLVTLRQSD